MKDIKLVMFICNKFRHSGLEFDDLVNEGFIALLKARKRYKEDAVFKKRVFYYIKGYIRSKIRKDMRRIKGSNEMIDFLSDNRGDPLVRIISVEEKMGFSSLLLKILSVKEKLAIDLYFYRGLTIREVAEEMKLTFQRINQLINTGLQKMKDYFNNANSKELDNILPVLHRTPRIPE